MSEEHGGGFPAFRQSGIPDGSHYVKVFTPGGEPVDRTGKASRGHFSYLRHEGVKKDPENFARKIARETEWADVIVLGPGIGWKIMPDAWWKMS